MQKWCRLLLLSRIPPKDCSMLHCFGCMVSMCFHWLLAFGIHSSSLGSKAFSGARAHFFCQEKQQEESSHHAHSANSPHGQILKLTTCPKDPKAQLWYSTSAPSELKAHSWWDYVIYVHSWNVQVTQVYSSDSSSESHPSRPCEVNLTTMVRKARTFWKTSARRSKSCHHRSQRRSERRTTLGWLKHFVETRVGIHRVEVNCLKYP